MRVNFLRLIQVFSENRRLRAELLVETGRRKHAEAQLNALRATAAASPCTERSVAQLAASIVHEINQPLSAILTNAQTCVRWLSRAQPDVPQAMQAALRTTRDTKRVVELVQGLRTLASRSRSPMAAVDLDDAIEEACCDCAPSSSTAAFVLICNCVSMARCMEIASCFSKS